MHWTGGRSSQPEYTLQLERVLDMRVPEYIGSGTHKGAMAWKEERQRHGSVMAMERREGTMVRDERFGGRGYVFGGSDWRPERSRHGMAWHGMIRRTSKESLALLSKEEEDELFWRR